MELKYVCTYIVHTLHHVGVLTRNWACNKIVELEYLRNYNLLTVITLFTTSIPRL